MKRNVTLPSVVPPSSFVARNTNLVVICRALVMLMAAFLMYVLGIQLQQLTICPLPLQASNRNWKVQVFLLMDSASLATMLRSTVLIWLPPTRTLLLEQKITIITTILKYIRQIAGAVMPSVY